MTILPTRGLSAMALTICYLIGASLAMAQTLLIEDVRLADPSQEQISAPTSVLIQDGLITAIGSTGSLELPTGVKRVDAAGMYLIPGLADMHVHLGDFGEAAPPLLVANGVTLVRDMGGDPAIAFSLREKIERGELMGPRIQVASGAFESRRWLNQVRAMGGHSLEFHIPYDTAIEAGEWIDLIQPLQPELIKVRNFPNKSAYDGLLTSAET